MTSMLRGDGAGSFCSRSCRCIHHSGASWRRHNAGMSGSGPKIAALARAGDHAGPLYDHPGWHPKSSWSACHPRDGSPG